MAKVKNFMAPTTAITLLSNSQMIDGTSARCNSTSLGTLETNPNGSTTVNRSELAPTKTPLGTCITRRSPGIISLMLSNFSIQKASVEAINQTAQINSKEATTSK